jgi:hypothetical protein
VDKPARGQSVLIFSYKVQMWWACLKKHFIRIIFQSKRKSAIEFFVSQESIAESSENSEFRKLWDVSAMLMLTVELFHFVYLLETCV